MSDAASLAAHIDRLSESLDRIRSAISERIFWPSEMIDAVVLAMAAGGHVLVEGPPGVGKTAVASLLGELMGGDFRRIQFTSDLMPADVTGTAIVLESGGRRRFEFQQGPLFANVVLADEIHRATPRTQAALVEALADGTVTVGNQSYELPSPHFVIATVGDLREEGVFPLPATMRDRFLLSLDVPTPQLAQLKQLIAQAADVAPSPSNSIASTSDWKNWTQFVRQVSVDGNLLEQAAKLVRSTSPSAAEASEVAKRYLDRGLGPRAGASLVLVAKAAAAMNGKTQATWADVEPYAAAVLRHRLVPNFDAAAEGKTVTELAVDVARSSR